jgi:hypothetical protein
VFTDICIDLIPVSFVISDSLTVGTDRKEALKRFDLLQGLFKLGCDLNFLFAM